MEHPPSVEYLPLTRPEPYTEIPAPEGMEPLFEDTLFPQVAPPGARSVDVLVTVPSEGSRVVMSVVVPRDGAEIAVGMAVRECLKLDDFEMTVRPFTA